MVLVICKITTVSGIVYGALAANFGLHVSIAAHVTANTILSTLEGLFCGDEIKYVRV